MLVCHFFVSMDVLMAFAEMKPDANTHQEPGNEYPPCDRFGQKNNRDNCS
jgi:hypothetical protein